MPWFENDGRMTAVDQTHPVDVLEPEEVEEPERGLSVAQFRELVIRIARTFFTGHPKITVIAWRIVAGDTWESIRACARRVGCSPQAVSRRLAIIKEEFGVIPGPRHQKRFDRWLRRPQKKRQEATRPPAAPYEDQLEEDDLRPKKGGHP